jgi:iron complex outermembrane receptor protein
MSAMVSAKKARSRSARFSEILLASAAAVSLFGVPAFAQTADQPGAAPTGGGLEEIVVTARKRSEDIQTVPVSITAISADTIQELSVRNFQDLRGFVPNLNITPMTGGIGGQVPGAVNLTIRGIGQGSNQVNVDPGVGLYVNDLYVARADGNEYGFFDLDNFQTLRGPQGTLFGKNTLGGAVLINTKLPTMNEYGGYLDVRVGNYNTIDTEGALNVPITDKVAIRLSFRTDNADGYITHLLNSGTSDALNDQTVRFQVRAKPTDNFTVDFLAEYSNSSTDGTASIETLCYNNAGYTGDYNLVHTTPYCTNYGPPNLGYYKVLGGATLSTPTDTAPGGVNAGNGYSAGQGPFAKLKIGTLNLRMVYDFDDNLSLKSVTGFRRTSDNYYSPTVDAPSDIYAELDYDTTTQISQEFDLNGRYLDGDLTFVAGLYYIQQNTGFDQDTGPDWDDPVGYYYIASNDFTSKAAFAQGTYKFFDNLDLTVGGRYNIDTKNAQSSVFDQTVGGNGASTPAYCAGAKFGFAAAFTTGGARCGGFYTGAATHNWYDFTPRAQLDYHITPDAFAYVSYSAGYQTGGFNQQLGTNLGGGLISYNPEKVHAYEGGLKTEWFDHTLRVNADGFYQFFLDYQATIAVTYNTVSTRAVQNAASAHEDGAEADVEYLPIPDLVIRANGAYLQQAYDQIGKGVNLTLTTPVTTAPQFQGSIEANYTYHLPSEATLVSDLSYHWQGSTPSCTPLGSCEVPNYGIWNFRVDYISADGAWKFGLWSTNITNQLYFLSYNATPSTSSGGTGVVTVQPGVPREFGAEVKYSFNGAAAEPPVSTPYTPPPVQAPMAAPSVAHSYMVFFDFNKSDLTSQAVAIVDQAAKNASPAKATQLVVTGHTDTVGSAEYNMRLSRRRAESVAAELEKQGIPSSEIEIVAKGKTDLLVPTADGVREPQNRRVQIVYGGAMS